MWNPFDGFQIELELVWSFGSFKSAYALPPLLLKKIFSSLNYGKQGGNDHSTNPHSTKFSYQPLGKVAEDTKKEKKKKFFLKEIYFLQMDSTTFFFFLRLHHYKTDGPLSDWQISDLAPVGTKTRWSSKLDD
ncbi:hypothetical protein CEXT_107411 [Caerostris extrusa]|uniref:Uncharacterized protein n=1 Tax=Caerostris extrusa TaxID=172846 RepID=A0AAV4SK46_CAEEX|nr:hypothetical protein CEXT_107411 [Caerostris extrusa]